MQISNPRLLPVTQDYFTRFGYVMDVYLPRDKVNRAEHRGFGFVTFETEAAVLRIHAHGQHQIKCVDAPVLALRSQIPSRAPWQNVSTSPSSCHAGSVAWEISLGIIQTIRWCL